MISRVGYTTETVVFTVIIVTQLLSILQLRAVIWSTIM